MLKKKWMGKTWAYVSDWLVDWLHEWLTDWLIGWLTDWQVRNNMVLLMLKKKQVGKTWAYVTGWLVDWLTDWLVIWPTGEERHGAGDAEEEAGGQDLGLCHWEGETSKGDEKVSILAFFLWSFCLLLSSWTLCVCVCVFPLRKGCVLFVCVSECVCLCVFLSCNDCSIPWFYKVNNYERLNNTSLDFDEYIQTGKHSLTLSMKQTCSLLLFHWRCTATK